MATRYFFVRCKNNPNNIIQHWIPHMSAIYAQCTCGQKTSYSKKEGLFETSDHYDKFQVDVVGKSWTDGNDEKAMNTLLLNPEKYKVEEFTELVRKTRLKK